MYFKFDDGILDCDLSFLQDLFALLDARLDQVREKIDASSDPDSMGYFDEAEYISGMGFIACQRYLTSTYGPLNIAKNSALSVGPVHAGGEFYARIINASANYWKHEDEWGLQATVDRDRSALGPQQLETIRIIETVTPWDAYTCANVLWVLTDPNESRLTNLVPIIEAWRTELDAMRVR